jgi:O6-methylguanine-DNA--protein-cysteine methyltransferase
MSDTAFCPSRSVGAVGNACSQNPLEFAIRCHRLLRGDGFLARRLGLGARRQSTIVGRIVDAKRKGESR